MSVKKWLTGLLVLVAMFVVVTTFGSLGVFADSRVATQPMEPEKEIVVELNDDFFNPKDITIPNGKSTTLKLKNVGRKEHTFTVKELSIDAEVQPGKEKTITVKPDKPGTYELICRYHAQEGMVGKVIVN
ncbi:cupredoxin domain-containing protein [Mesobacillus maritimus]|uniref:Cupredoxin domain-containing protein n=1 Tax=Mesobacillus maritimus TaxID=1643336 RepID=A0ABS7K089_9BACI|nr:cupredoxin domain-containing protein [Mesobacillus maritimus]MBY0095668.1 cupredoxin domain-containing protein [Mesobacillus maritimus]